MANKAYPSHQEMQEAALALLRALGVQDTSGIVSFSLHFHCRDVPHLRIDRLVNLEMGDKTTLEAAAALAPGVLTVEETAGT